MQEGETRIALTENGRLVDLHVEQTTRERTVGNIYKAVIVKVNSAFQAAFVDYGEKRNGFLSISDLNPQLFEVAGERSHRSKIQSVLKNGQTVMVQVLKEGVGDKGAALTTNISLPGRFLVLTPHSDRSGVSRKIEDTEKRGPLKDILAGLMSDENMGIIIRTAGIDRSPVDLKKDLNSLKKDWISIEAAFKNLKKPGLIKRESASLERVLRDYFSEQVEEVWVDSAEAFQEALTYFKSVLPKFQKRLKLYVGDQSLFANHGIERQMEELDSSKVHLKSGGGIVIESTEALVSIDVNSGKSNQASDIETTALNTNMEAAEEVARQLRLRNLGGLIVVDFIDMMQEKNRAKVAKALADGLKNDKARTTLGEISQFGLLEMSRQRIDMELSRGTHTQCAHCGGTGSVPTVNTFTNMVLRKIREIAASGQHVEVQGELPLEYANFLLNFRREALRDLELEFDIRILISGNPGMPTGTPISLTGVRETAQEEPARVEALPMSSPEQESEEEPSSSSASSRSRGRRRRPPRSGAEETPREVVAAKQEDFSAEDAGGLDLRDVAEEELIRDSVTEAVPLTTEGNGDGGTWEGEKEVGRSSGGRGKAPLHPPIPAVSAGGIVSSKRGGWISTLGHNSPVGETLFESAHQPVKPSIFPVIQPTFKRSSVFTGVEAEIDSTLFISTHLPGNEKSGMETGEEDSPAPAKGRGRGGSRAKGGRGSSAAAEKLAEKSADEKSAAAKSVAKKKAPARRAPKPSAAKSATSARSRGRSPATPA